MLESVRALGLEGVIAKRIDAPYVSSRSDTWLKLKCKQQQELVVCGFVDRAGAVGEVGALLLGYHDHGKLEYAGNVGTGWDAAAAADLHQRAVAVGLARPLRWRASTGAAAPQRPR